MLKVLSNLIYFFYYCAPISFQDIIAKRQIGHAFRTSSDQFQQTRLTNVVPITDDTCPHGCLDSGGNKIYIQKL